MYRSIWLIVLLAAVGCTPTSTTPTTAPPLPKPLGDGFPINYAGWPTLTEEPVVTNMAVMLDCRAPTPYKLNADGTSPEGVNSPHYVPTLRYLASPDHAAAVKMGQPPYPVGTTIVKEKLSSAEAKPYAVAAMIKREKGYDTNHGDWEYVYTTLGDKPVTQRGKLESCIQCHRIKKEVDYLYRSYLSRRKK